jgi:NADPH:quinone reductase-like Zn-dependent oxidoreductase
MKAVICERYGPPEVLKIQEVNKPTPNSQEVLVKIIATAVNSADIRIRGLKVPGVMRVVMRFVLGFTKPRQPILGVVLSGVIEAVGDEVKDFKPGDEVYAATGFKCGAYAEYITVKASKAIALKPKKASFEEAAAIPFGGTAALYFLKKAGIEAEKEQKVLIYGASGAVGSAAVQIAKHFGAEVTAVCGNDSTEMVKSLGADHIIVYTKEDFIESGGQYGIIFDAVGKTSKKACAKLLAPAGRYVTVDSLDVASETNKQLQFLSELFDNGEYKAVIDRMYALEDIVEAHRYVDQGKKKGNVVITVSRK